MRNGGWVGVGVVVVAAGALGGCAGNKALSNPAVAELRQPDALIQLRRAGCVADQGCPIYSVSIFADGTVTYEGRANVAVVGTRREKIPVERLADLVSRIETTGFLDSPEQCCVCEGSDEGGHMVLIDYRPGRIEKTIVNDDACRSAPASMRELERAIDDATISGRWTVGPRANRPPASVAATERRRQP
jgi:hypothetical protein